MFIASRGQVIRARCEGGTGLLEGEPIGGKQILRHQWRETTELACGVSRMSWVLVT